MIIYQIFKYVIIQMVSILAEISITKETRLINDETLQQFSNALSSASWDDIVNDNDVNHSYRKFVNIFSETFNSSFPIRRGSPPKKRKHKPWMTKGLVNACKKRIYYINIS